MAKKTSLKIGAAVGVAMIGMLKDQPVPVHPVEVKKNGQTYTARVGFNKVNSIANWSLEQEIGAGSALTEEAWQVVEGALIARGERKLFKVLAEDAS